MNATPTALFDSYQQDLKRIISSISDKLEGSGKNQVGEQRKAALRNVELELDEADDLVSRLEAQTQLIPQSLKAPYASRLKDVKSDLTKYKKLSKDLQTQTQTTGSGLFGVFNKVGGSLVPDNLQTKNAGTNLLGGFTKVGGALTPGNLQTQTQAAGTNLVGAFNKVGGTLIVDPIREINERTRLLEGAEILTDGVKKTTHVALDGGALGAGILTDGVKKTAHVALDAGALGVGVLHTVVAQGEQIVNVPTSLLGNVVGSIGTAVNTLTGMLNLMQNLRTILTVIGVSFIGFILFVTLV